MATLYFAMYYPTPTQRIILMKREAKLVDGIYRFSRVSGLRSRIMADEVDTCIGNDCAVSTNPNQAVRLLRGQFNRRAAKLERKAERLRCAATLIADWEEDV